MAKPENRTQNINSKKPWFKSALLPWIIIIVISASGASFVAGWMARSGEVTMNDVHRAVQVELDEAAEAAPKQ